MWALVVASLLLPSYSQLSEYSALDGSGNNLANPARGAELDRYASPNVRSYADGIGTIPTTLPSARRVSMTIGKQKSTKGSSSHSVAMLAWGQTVAHDVGDMHVSMETAPIEVPRCDERFDPSCTGSQTLGFNRGEFAPASSPRSFYNYASSWIDASWLYGPRMVREHAGGRLLLPSGKFPHDSTTAVQGRPECMMQIAADPRASENLGLLNMYILFGREHNRIAATLNSSWNDETLFQEARMRTIALVQKITLEEYGPALLGTTLKTTPASYDETLDPRIDLQFATAAYRYGHSAVPSNYRYGDTWLPLRDWQFQSCVTMLDSDLVIRGMQYTPINDVDTQYVADVRNHLKTNPSTTTGAHDLFSTNIQRGRDVGLPGYNDARQLLGFSRVNSFEEMAAGTGVDPADLQSLYGDVDKVDFYVGGLLERKELETEGSGSAELGATFARVIRDQFQRLRKGDRFWYEWHSELSAFVENRGLQQVIEDNVPGTAVPAQPFMLAVPDAEACEAFLEDASPMQAMGEYSTLDGSGNNQLNPTLGSAGSNYASPTSRGYSDGVGALVTDRPSAREVSMVIGQQKSTSTTSSHSVAMLAWGQTIAHDVGDMHGSAETAPIAVPMCDSDFDTACTGTETLGFNRAQHVVPPSGGPREFPDHVSHFIDASWLYGDRMVREFAGGRMLLPNRKFPHLNNSAPQGWPECEEMISADGRASENLGLLNMYVLFAREHNRIAASLAADNPGWGDETLFQETRMRVIALTQKITLEEYGPALLGTSLKTADGAYDPSVDPSIETLFAVAAYRYGHSAIPGAYRYGEEWLPLRDWQFQTCVTMLDSDLVIRGMQLTPINDVDTQFVTDVRSHLKTSFSTNIGAHDLFSTNIQRGRDVGIPSYNTVRQMLGLPQVTSFQEIVGDSGVSAQDLATLYGDVDKVDFYVGGLLERKELATEGSGSSELGLTFATIIRNQFQKLRVGDRFWYEWNPTLAEFVADRGMQQVIRDNVPGGDVAASPFSLARCHLGETACSPQSSSGASGSLSYALSEIGMTLSWELLPDDKIELQISGPKANHGWVAVGFGPSSTSMANVDYMVVKFDGSGCTVADHWGEQHAVAPVQDSGAASFDSTSCEVVSGEVTATAVRPLGATDSQDASIDINEQAFLYAAGPNSWAAYHGANRAGGTISLATGSVSTDSDDRLRRIWNLHGLAMALLFLGGWPVAIFSMMFFRHSRWGFFIHKLIGQFGVGAVILTALCMILTTPDTLTGHGVMGIMTVMAAVLLAVMGNAVEASTSRFRKYMRVVHKTVGYTVMLTVPLTCWLGFRLLLPFESPALESSPVIWYLPTLILVALAIAERIYRRKRKEMSWSDVRKRIAQGQQLLVIDGMVLDISSWANSHPGGAEVMKQFIGCDATPYFKGQKAHRDQYNHQRKFQHSPAAYSQLRSLMVGKIVEVSSIAKEADDFEHDHPTEEAGDHGYKLRLVSNEECSRFASIKRMTFVAECPLFKGHSVTLSGPDDLQREYSPVEEYVDGGELKMVFYIKVYEKGPMSTYLGNLHEGGIVPIGPGSGKSILSNSDGGCWNSLVMFAAGTGITPFLKLINHYASHFAQIPLRSPELEKFNVMLVWWVTGCDEAFVDQARFSKMIQLLKGRLSVRIHFTREDVAAAMNNGYKKTTRCTLVSGRDVDGAMKFVKEQLTGVSTHQSDRTRFYICGPSNFCKDMSDRVKISNVVPNGCIHVL